MPSNDPYIGRQLGGYDVLKLLGQGGMGAVYLGRNPRLGKLVAVKVLPANIQSRPEFVERFKREARLAAQLDHPNIVRIYDYGEEQSTFFYVMEYVEGESLADRLKDRGRLAPKEALEVVIEVAKGLERAHESGLVHRDIKPDNIMISKRGQVMITDFGLVKNSSDSAEGNLTATGAILGTPYYMAPEQCEGLPDIDARADVYALGLVFYALLTGKVPVEGKTPLQIIHSRITKDTPPPILLAPKMHPELNQAVLEMIQRERDQRLFPTARVRERLEMCRPLVQDANEALVPSQASWAEITAQRDTDTDQARASGAASGTVGVSAQMPNAGMGGDSQSLMQTSVQAAGGRAPLFLILFLLVLVIGGGGAVVALMLAKSRPESVIITKLEKVPAFTKDSVVRFIGQANVGGAIVTVNSESQPAGSEGDFNRAINLVEGENTVSLKVQSPGIKGVDRSFTIVLDTVKPQIEWRSNTQKGPRGVALVVGEDRKIEGRVQDKNLATLNVTYGDQEGKLDFDSEGLFEWLIPEGVQDGQRIDILARDKAGHEALLSATLRFLKSMTWAEFTPPPSITRESQVTLAGRVSRAGVLTLKLNDFESQSQADGSFKRAVQLKEGRNVLTIQVTDTRDGESVKKSVVIVRDSQSPSVALPALKGKKLFANAGQSFEATITDPHLAEVLVNDKPLKAESGQYRVVIDKIVEGQTWTLSATDKAGNRKDLSFQVFTAVDLQLTLSVKSGSWVKERAFSLPLSCNGKGVVFEVRGQKIPSKNGEASVQLELIEGLNEILVTVRNAAKQRADTKILLNCDTRKPVIELDEVKDKSLVWSPETMLTGKVIEEHLKSLTIAGKPVELLEGGLFKWSFKGFDESQQSLVIKAVDLAGHESTETLTLKSQPADPKEALKAIWGALADHKSWKSASVEDQKAIVDKIAARLEKAYPGAYKLKGFEKFSCGGQSFRVAQFEHGPTSVIFHLLPGGTFKLGSKAKEGDTNERPARDVTLLPFMMARYELSQKSFDKFPGRDRRAWKGVTYPIEGVTWNDAVKWCQGVGEGFRLPSEAEWEYACRAGTQTKYFWGDKFDPAFCWHDKNSLAFGSGSKRPRPFDDHHRRTNAFGLSDMLGNVREWCADHYEKGYSHGPDDNTPRTNKNAKERVARGGSYFFNLWQQRCARRWALGADYQFKDLGFRVAVSIP